MKCNAHLCDWYNIKIKFHSFKIMKHWTLDHNKTQPALIFKTAPKLKLRHLTSLYLHSHHWVQILQSTLPPLFYSEGWRRSSWLWKTWATAAFSLENILSQSLHCLALPRLRSRFFFTWMRVMTGLDWAPRFLLPSPEMCNPLIANTRLNEQLV